MAEAGALELNPDYYRDPGSFSAIPYVVDTLDKSAASQLDAAKRRSELTKARGVSQAEKEQYEAELAQVNAQVVSIVERDFEGFTSSVRGFSSIFQEFTEAQNKVRRLKEYVRRSKDTLVHRKRNLKDLWFQKLQHKRVLELLAKMEDIKAAPPTIARLLREEKFVECVELFERAYSQSFGEDLVDIGALGEIRDTLISYRERMFDALVEALIRYLSGDRSAGDSQLSSKAVLSLDAIVIALIKLGRLSAALHAVKSNLREQLGEVIREQMDAAAAQLTPLAAASSQTELEDLRLESMFRKILVAFRAIFTRHVQFATIIKTEAEDMERNYSVQETWSTIQVEVQQLLELHLAVFSDEYARDQRRRQRGASAGAPNAPLNAVKFRFASARAATLEVTGGAARAAAAGDLVPACPPSPYRLLPLLEPVVHFAAFGDRLAGTSARPQLLGYVRSFCTDTLVAAMVGDALQRLDEVASGSFAWEPSAPDDACACCTTLGTALCAELRRASRFAAGLALVDCKVDVLVIELVERFVSFTATSLAEQVAGRACSEWLEGVRHLLKDDPNYRAIISDAPAADYDDLAKFRKACATFVQEERSAEAQLEERIKSRANLLSTSHISCLAAIHSTCDLLFRTLALRAPPGSDPATAAAAAPPLAPLSGPASASRDRRASQRPAKSRFAQQEVSATFAATLDEPAIASVLASPAVRGRLAKLDELAEHSLFALRSELRIRCVVGLQPLAGEMAQPDAPPASGSALAQDLVRCARVIEPLLTRQHGPYLVRSLCGLVCELVVRAVPAYLEHMRARQAPQPKPRSTSKFSRKGSRKKAQLHEQQQQEELAASGFSKAHLRFADQAVLLLQQTMWTMLLNSLDAPDRPWGEDGERASLGEGSEWEAARDQLTAFDGTRRFLQSLLAAPEAPELEAASQALLGALSPEALAHIAKTAAAAAAESSG